MTYPSFSKPNTAALLAAAAMFAALLAVSSFGQNVGPSVPWTVFSLVKFIAAGFLLGFLARRSALMHGLILAALTMPIEYLLLYLVFGSFVGFEATAFSYYLIRSGLLCTIGTLCGVFVASRFGKS